MHQQNWKKAAAPVILAAAFAALGSPSAQAGATPFDPSGNASQVGASTVTTPPYTGMNGDNYGTFSQTVGGNTLTFSDGSVFTRIDAPFDVDYPLGTALIQTSDADNKPTGPLQIVFSQGVSAFGVQVQDYAYDLETFTLQAYDGTTLLGTFPLAQFDNNSGQAPQNPGKSVFVGAAATGGDVITKVIISSKSVDAPSKQETKFSNDFFAGPVAIPAAVPEASTWVSSGMGIALLSGLLFITARRKRTAAG